MKYEQRVIAFIDILGFRNIVTLTESNLEYQEKIYSVLESMKSEIVGSQMAGEMTEAVPEDLKEQVAEDIKLFGQIFKDFSTIQVTHFSDSIVISVSVTNPMDVMTVFEYIGRLIFKLWYEFNILIRGGIAMGDLIHEENGVLFGPAMVSAYDYESNLSNYPRIIIDEVTSNAIRHTEDYQMRMTSLFADFNDEVTKSGKTYTIKNGLEINLATSIDHLLNSHFGLIPESRARYIDCIEITPKLLRELKDQSPNDRTKEKYDYLIDQFTTHFPT